MDLIKEFWKSKEGNFSSWHVTQLSYLYKGKGDQHVPNNWRAACLKETSAKIVSTIIPKTVLSRLKDIEIPYYQFGMFGAK